MLRRPTIEILGPDDVAEAEAFLLPRAESSMFLIGNLREAGLVDQGERYQGAYAAARQDGHIVALAAHYWNENLILQAPIYLDSVWKEAVKASGRPIKGLLGPSDQVGKVKAKLGINASQVRLDSVEILYGLNLAELVLPPKLVSGEVAGRTITATDLDTLAAWQAAYAIETLGEQERPGLWREQRAALERSLPERRWWVLEDDECPVSCSSFNARIDEMVQVGGVWTPSEFRCRGYGRAVVAVSLLDARASGVAKAILFTGAENTSAQKAYEALGFRRIGDYRIVLMNSPIQDIGPNG